MRIWIPLCGDCICLDKIWMFCLKNERRNADFLKAFGSAPDTALFMPVGTELVFDRLYVRQGADDWASVTFIIKKA